MTALFARAKTLPARAISSRVLQRSTHANLNDAGSTGATAAGEGAAGADIGLSTSTPRSVSIQIVEMRLARRVAITSTLSIRNELCQNGELSQEPSILWTYMPGRAWMQEIFFSMVHSMSNRLRDRFYTVAKDMIFGALRGRGRDRRYFGYLPIMPKQLPDVNIFASRVVPRLRS